MLRVARLGKIRSSAFVRTGGGGGIIHSKKTITSGKSNLEPLLGYGETLGKDSYIMDAVSLTERRGYVLKLTLIIFEWMNWLQVALPVTIFKGK